MERSKESRRLNGAAELSGVAIHALVAAGVVEIPHSVRNDKKGPPRSAAIDQCESSSQTHSEGEREIGNIISDPQSFNNVSLNRHIFYSEK